MTTHPRLRRLLGILVDENKDLQGMQLPLGQDEQRSLFRALRNIRFAEPVSDEFLGLQDEELREQLAEKGTVQVADTDASPVDDRLRLWQGDITRLEVDAIVNAANSQMLGCFAPGHHCIDNAIHSAAGVQLRQECYSLMQAQGHDEPTGQAKITKGYNLPARHVIHTVGPIIPDGRPTPNQVDQLASCYTSCLDLASQHGLESIAFCCISTGVFRFPNDEAASTAVSAVRDWLAAHPNSSVKTIIFNVFKDTDNELYRQILFPSNDL